MNKLTHAASILALTVAASSASAWYAPTFQSGCMTDEQKQAVADQQQAMAAQYAKAAQQAMAAQQEMARKMAEQQAAYYAQMQPNASEAAPQVATQVVPQSPVVADPFAGNPFGPVAERPDFPQMPEMPAFERPAMPDFPPMPQMPEFGAHEFPAMPEMPAFERPAMPDFPDMPEMPGIAGADYPAMPQMPGFKRPTAYERDAQIDAYRTQAKKELDARRAALRDMSERRRAARPMARRFGPRSVAYIPHSMMAPNMGCGPSVTAAPVPQQQIEVAPQQPETISQQTEAAPVASPVVAAPAQQ